MNNQELEKLYNSGEKHGKPMKLESSKGTYTWMVEHENEANRVKKKFLDDSFKNGQRHKAENIFAPENDPDESSDAYIEEIIHPEEGGTFVKLYGCSYLYKGAAPAPTVFAMQLPKAIFVDLPKQIIGRSLILQVAILTLFFFQRQKLLEMVNSILFAIEWRVLQNFDIPYEQYNELEKELGRATELAVKDEPLVWQQIFTRFIRIFCLIMFIDNTYRFRFQDAIGALQKPDFFKMLDVLTERENKSGAVGVAWKWKMIKKAAKVAFFLSPILKRIVNKIFNGLKIEKIKMDEADIYFSLLFKSYNIGGIPLAERKADWERLNRERHHVFII